MIIHIMAPAGEPGFGYRGTLNLRDCHRGPFHHSLLCRKQGVSPDSVQTCVASIFTAIQDPNDLYSFGGFSVIIIV